MDKKLNLYFTNFVPIGSRALQVFIYPIFCRAATSLSTVQLPIASISRLSSMVAGRICQITGTLAFGLLILWIPSNKYFANFYW